MLKRWLPFLALALILGFSSASAEPTPYLQTTGLPISGTLYRDGSPYTGPCHVLAKLWDAETGGDELASVVVGYVNVVDGAYRTSADFGATDFDGRRLWLEVSFRCAGEADYTAEYRQEVEPAGYALYSNAAGIATTVPWSGLSGSGCSVGDVRKWSGTGWECAPDETGAEGTTYYPGYGLVLTDTTFHVLTDTIQVRISGSCPEGDYAVSVGQDGALYCAEGIAGPQGPEGPAGPPGSGANIVAGWGITSTGGTTPTVSSTITNGAGLAWSDMALIVTSAPTATTAYTANVALNVPASIITGTGTSGYVPRFIGSTHLGNGVIQDDGARVGVAVAPDSSFKLHTYDALIDGNMRIGGALYSSAMSLDYSSGSGSVTSSGGDGVNLTLYATNAGTFATTALTLDPATGLNVSGSGGGSTAILGSAAVGVRVTNTLPITLTTSGSQYLLTFNSENFDPLDMHSTSSNTSRLTAGYTGVYLINLTVQFASNATGTRVILILLNANGSCSGGLTIGAGVTPPASSGGYTTVLNTSTAFYLSAGDYVEACAQQNSGGSLSVLSANSYSPAFSMVRIP